MFALRPKNVDTPCLIIVNHAKAFPAYRFPLLSYVHPRANELEHCLWWFWIVRYEIANKAIGDTVKPFIELK